MSNKPKFDPSQLASLMNRGAAEARGGVGRSLASVPTTTDGAAEIAPVQRSIPDQESPAMPAAQLHVAEAAEHTPHVAPVNTGKRSVTVLLSDDVAAALYHYQAELRSRPSTRLAKASVSAVVDSLLRQALKIGN